MAEEIKNEAVEKNTEKKPQEKKRGYKHTKEDMTYAISEGINPEVLEKLKKIG